jgi:XRE family transcriptional regulator of biofilm formation
MTINKHIGQKIRAMRDQRGISLSDLAAKSTLSKSTISEIENGVHSNPTASTLSKLASALGISAYDLIAVDENQSDYLERDSRDQSRQSLLAEPSMGYSTQEDAPDKETSEFIREIIEKVRLLNSAQRDELKRFIDYLNHTK